MAHVINYSLHVSDKVGLHHHQNQLKSKTSILKNPQIFHIYVINQPGLNTKKIEDNYWESGYEELAEYISE